MLAEKAIPIYEPFSLNFRVEFFNAFNHVQLAGLDTTLGTANFGYITPTQYNSPRSIQASLRVSF